MPLNGKIQLLEYRCLDIDYGWWEKYDEEDEPVLPHLCPHCAEAGEPTGSEIVVFPNNVTGELPEVEGQRWSYAKALYGEPIK